MGLQFWCALSDDAMLLKKKEDPWNICVPEPLQSCAHVWSCVTNLKQLWLVSVDVSLPVCLWCCEVYVLVNHHLWWHPMIYSIVTLSFSYIFFYKWKKCSDVSQSQKGKYLNSHLSGVGLTVLKSNFFYVLLGLLVHLNHV